jgi:iron complex transport system substrate-binding protein
MRLVAVIIALLHSLGSSVATPVDARSGARPPQRIVSLAPSITELLFALGLGDRLVGVTTYCRYPPAALRIARIGGYLTPSYEALAAARADLAILLPEHDDVRRRVEEIGIPTLRVNHNTLQGILESSTAIGERCDVGRRAAALRGEWQGQLDTIARTVGGRRPPRVIVCMGRAADPAGFRSMTAAGPGGIYHDLVVRAGGANAIPPGPVLHPSLSAESLLNLDPDVIVEFEAGGAADRLLASWHALPTLRAVQTGRVYVFTHDFLPVPGPRLLRFVGELARALHPEAPWRQP